MTHDASHARHGRGGAEQFLRRGRWVFLGLFAIAALLLILEHRAHFLGALPYLLLLACPLLHIFMHGGHGGHGVQSEESRSPQAPAIRNDTE